MMTDVFVVAVERSGDDIGAALIKDLRELSPKINIKAIGGSAIEAQGLTSLMDIDGLSILGIIEGVMQYPLVRRKVKDCADQIIKSQAKSVILIDSWGFMIRVAARLKALGYSGKIIKYLAPQVWAMRAGRAKTLAKHTDLLLSIQPMDAPYFEPHGLETHYVGNPVFDIDYGQGDATKIHERLGRKEGPILSVWFGSRPSEIERLAAPFCETISRFKAQYPDLSIISPLAESVTELVMSKLSEYDAKGDIHLLPENAKHDAMAASTLALACSGTVTTQLASVGIPTVVAYKLNALTFAMVKPLFRPAHISIVNIAADDRLMPEFVQGDVTAESLSEALEGLLEDKTLRSNMSKALRAQTRKMGAGSEDKASKKAARHVLAAL